MTHKMNEKVKIGLMNTEQRKAIDKLEEVLNFFKSTHIKDEDVLGHINTPLDDLQSSLKYIPIKPYFEIIPTETKTNILNYLCDSNAFIAASVCLEWKEILGSRFTEKTVTISEPCCSCQCGDQMCLNSVINSEMLRASATHKLDVHLSICHSVRAVDSNLVTEALTSVSKFSITGTCSCDDFVSLCGDSFEANSTETEYECAMNPMSADQLKDLFQGLEKKKEDMEEVKLECLDLTELSQDSLVNCFVNKIKNLTLRESVDHSQKMFSFETLVNKLSQESSELKLNKLTLDILDDPDEFALELANALCNVENVKLCEKMPLRWATVTQLIENIVTDTHPVKIKTLIIKKWTDFRTLINPEDLKKLYNKMMNVRLEGDFTLEQVKAARSLPGVKVCQGIFEKKIEKGFNIF